MDPAALARIRLLAEAGADIVAMVRPVQAVLNHTSLPHRCLIHPAARGAIRARAAYQAHVAAVLGLSPPVATRLYPAILAPAGVAEVGLCLWLLLRGVHVPRWRALATASA